MSNHSVGMFGPGPSHRSTRGFTLVEILIVLGIIALLITILLAVMSRVREASHRTACMSNLGTIAKAVLAYVNENEGFFPYAASRISDDPRASGTPEGHLSADWIFWQCGQSDKLPANSIPPPPPSGNGLVIDAIAQGGIGKYLGGCNDQSLSGLAMLRCPSDQRLFNSVMGSQAPGMGYPPNANNQSPYPFSYVLNALMCSANYTTNGAQGFPSPGYVAIAKTLAKVKDNGSKILVYEEDPRTIDDGSGLLMPNGGATEMLAIRHNAPEIDDTTPPGISDPRDPVMATFTPPTPTSPGQLTISNPGKQGNVAFCDGHAEVMQRGTAHLKEHWAPDPALFPTFP
jgi:prepilin-type N-terminal cleavage/methylation domain-containing protein/prepilin-type processing-associated H-X9-DG protein